MRSLILAATICWLVAISPAAGLAQTPFDLRFDDAPDFTTWTVPAGGWQLALTITVSDDELVDIGGFDDAWQPAGADWRLWLVSQDPDGCPSWAAPQGRAKRAVGSPRAGRCQLSADQPWPADETWLEASLGRYGLILIPAADARCDRQPWVSTFSLEPGAELGHNSSRTFLGPCSNASYGYGRHPGLPQLVVLANQGPGVVFDDGFQAAAPARRRNLAGFFEDIGFRWRGPDHQRQVTAQMRVPRGLLSSVVAIDHHPIPTASGDANSDVGHCQELRSYDGGEPYCASWTNDTQTRLEIMEPTLLHAFLVAGDAPAELMDVDGDGDVDSADAEASGFRLLSQQAAMAIFEHRGETYLNRDLDGNGKAWSDTPVPGSPVQVTIPPP